MTTPTHCPVCNRPPTIKSLPSSKIKLYHRCHEFYLELHGNGERDNYVQIWNNVLKSLENKPSITVALTEGQKRLMKKHGTPALFAAACYQCVPGEISMDEAKSAIEKYNREWNTA